MFSSKNGFFSHTPWSRLDKFSQAHIMLMLYLLGKFLLSFLKILFSMILANLLAAILLHAAGLGLAINFLKDDFQNPAISFSAVALLFMEFVNLLTADREVGRILIAAGFLFFTASLIVSSGYALRDEIESCVSVMSTVPTTTQMNILILLTTSMYLALTNVFRLKIIFDKYTTNLDDNADDESVRDFPQFIINALTVIRHHNILKHYVDIYNDYIDEFCRQQT